MKRELYVEYCYEPPIIFKYHTIWYLYLIHVKLNLLKRGSVNRHQMHKKSLLDIHSMSLRLGNLCEIKSLYDTFYMHVQFDWNNAYDI